MYRPNFYESTCLRCNEIVYQVDRVGPLKDFTFFHSGCFKCCHCGTKLTLKTYYNNQHKHDDKEVCMVFCYSFFVLRFFFMHFEETFLENKIFLSEDNIKTLYYKKIDSFITTSFYWK